MTPASPAASPAAVDGGVILRQTTQDTPRILAHWRPRCSIPRWHIRDCL